MPSTLSSDWSEDDIKSWLLTWSSGGPSEVCGLPSQVAVPVAVQAIFNAEDPARRETMKRGLVRALCEWQRAAGFSALTDLAYIAASIRASSAVPVLASIAEGEFDRLWSDEQSRALSAAVAAIAGFGPTSEVQAVLRRLLYHARCDPRLGAQLYIGVVQCNPQEFTLHAPRFLRLREQVDSRFRSIGLPLLRAISPPVLIEGFGRLSPDHQREFVELLRPIRRSPIEISVSKKGLRLIWSEQPKWEVVVDPDRRDPIEPFADHLRDLLASGPRDVNDMARLIATPPAWMASRGTGRIQ